MRRDIQESFSGSSEQSGAMSASGGARRGRKRAAICVLAAALALSPAVYAAEEAEPENIQDVAGEFTEEILPEQPEPATDPAPTQPAATTPAQENNTSAPAANQQTNQAPIHEEAPTVEAGENQEGPKGFFGKLIEGLKNAREDRAESGRFTFPDVLRFLLGKLLNWLF